MIALDGLPGDHGKTAGLERPAEGIQQWEMLKVAGIAAGIHLARECGHSTGDSG